MGVLTIPPLVEWDLKNLLPPRQPISERWHLLALSLLAVYTISYLVHIPPPPSPATPTSGSKETKTRDKEKHPISQWICYALLPVALGCGGWFWLTVDFSRSTSEWAARGNFIFVVLSSSIRWTFSPTRPSYHPLPRPPLLNSLRQTTAFKALNLPLMEYRLHGLTQYSPAYKAGSRGYLRTVSSHLAHFILRLLIFDALSLLIYRLDPLNLGRIGYPGEMRDWDAGMDTIAAKLGVSRFLVPIGFTLVSTIITWAGVVIGWDRHAFYAVGSGIWAAEEWPAVTDKPWMSTSLNELWGRRYHTYLKNVFHNLTLPLFFLPRSLYIPRIFLGSAIHHMILIYPYTGTFSFRANFIQYMSLAMGCMAERLFYRSTGKRVGGWTGRVWTWTVFLGACYYGTREWYEVGWAGWYRSDLRGVSPVEKMLGLMSWDQRKSRNVV